MKINVYIFKFVSINLMISLDKTKINLINNKIFSYYVIQIIYGYMLGIFNVLHISKYGIVTKAYLPTWKNKNVIEV